MHLSCNTETWRFGSAHVDGTLPRVTAPSAPSSRNILFVLVGVAGLGCAFCTGGLWFMRTAATELLTGEPQWSAGSIAERDVPAIFGVRFPAKPPTFRGRQSGFQDPVFELLVKLPPNGRERFLAANGLTAGGELPPHDTREAEQAIEKLEPKVTLSDAASLEGLTDVEADGGYVELYRTGALLTTDDGATWIYLVAYGT